MSKRIIAAAARIIPILEKEKSLSPAARVALVDLVSAFERDELESHLIEQVMKASERLADLVDEMAYSANDGMCDEKIAEVRSAISTYRQSEGKP